MGLFALFLGLFGALTGIMSILTALETIPPLTDTFTSTYWLEISAVLFLACIAVLLTGGGGRQQS